MDDLDTERLTLRQAEQARDDFRPGDGRTGLLKELIARGAASLGSAYQ
jgi:hypothetical protein